MHTQIVSHTLTRIYIHNDMKRLDSKIHHACNDQIYTHHITCTQLKIDVGLLFIYYV